MLEKTEELDTNIISRSYNFVTFLLFYIAIKLIKKLVEGKY